MINILKAVLVLVVVALVLFIGIPTLNLKVIGPWQHKNNTEAAEASNDKIWETRLATIYTIEARFELNGEEGSASIDLICAQKIQTETISLKGGPYVWDYVGNVGRHTFLFPVSEEYGAEFQLPRSCKKLTEFRQGQRFTLPPEDYYSSLVTIRRQSHPLVACFEQMSGGSVQFGPLRVFPLTIVSVRSEMLKNVLTREEFGPADRAVARELMKQNGAMQTLRDAKYRGNKGDDCWES